MVARSLYKIIVGGVVLLSSCTQKCPDTVECYGVSLDRSSFFVDVVQLDSISFASGKRLWTIHGVIVHKGVEYPFRNVYGKNPFLVNTQPFRVSPPAFLVFNSNDSVDAILTAEGKNIGLSWRGDKQFLWIRSRITSRH